MHLVAKPVDDESVTENEGDPPNDEHQEDPDRSEGGEPTLLPTRLLDVIADPAPKPPSEEEHLAHEYELVDRRPGQHDGLEEVVERESDQNDPSHDFEDTSPIHGQIMNGRGSATIP